MKNPVHFNIEESLPELKNLRSKQATLSKQKRVDCLIHLKASKLITRQELANHLGIHIRTQERWLAQYRAGLFCAMGHPFLGFHIQQFQLLLCRL